MKTLVRNLVVLAAAAVAVLLFGWLRGEWDAMHRWNRAFGDTAFILIALTMALGPIVALLPRASPVLPWRRELGIYSGVAATVHTAIVFIAWFGSIYGGSAVSLSIRPFNATCWRNMALALPT